MLDSLSIIPNSEIVIFKGEVLKKEYYFIDYAKSYIVFNEEKIGSIKLKYRVFPLNFSTSTQHKKINQLTEEQKLSKNPFLFEHTAQQEDIFYLNGLNKSGSISRGVTFGNNQDLAVNSNLNLQLSGKLNDEISLIAVISDDNIPIQAEGNTQQLQEFDKVYIQLYRDNIWKLTAGDFILSKPKSYFMTFNKKAQGGSYEINYKSNTNNKEKIKYYKSSISAAISKGKFSRNILKGVEGNQGPYRLKGAENETFIIVLSGTEQVFVDGRLMTRGQDNDYIIDYNTAEITFTAKKLITKDSRIVVEFQYSDKNYARSMVHFSQDYKSNKLELNLNVYGEQDSKNQPLQQDLQDDEKELLRNIGDSLDLAVVPNIKPVDFSTDLVLYKMIDTLGYDSVLVYSTNPDSAKYQVGFSYVGPNNGNYNQIKSAANGKVYQWAAPIGSIKQGSYEPVVVLATPKERQMIALAGRYKFSKNANVNWETALSNYDLNTFSSKDSKDDIGYAFKLNSDNKIPLSSIKKPWMISLGTVNEYVDINFTPIERYRVVEFERNWNISALQLNSSQLITSAYTGLEKEKIGKLIYQFSSLQNINEFEGYKNELITNLNHKGFSLVGGGSYLTTKGLNKTNFIRSKTEFKKQINWIEIGVNEETELNQFYNPNTDSLLLNSYQFYLWRVFVQSADTTTNKFVVSYQQREDKQVQLNKFQPTTFAEDIDFGVDLLKNPNHLFKTKFTYRKLQILTPTLSTLKPEENILSRIEYVAKFLKNAISTSTFYEIGSGLEVKKEFSFLEVQPGQGTHAYIGDLDSNNVKDLNEFEVAAFQDEANYIKIFTPTNDYIRTYSNQFSQGLNLRPEARWMNKKGIRKMIARFSNRTNYRVARKTRNKDNYYNPFIAEVIDSNLVTINSSFLNTIYFNRTSVYYGFDFTYQENKDKSFLTNGFEARDRLNRALRGRWNITKQITLHAMGGNGVKINSSEFFKNRNYYINNIELEPKITFQPNVKFRTSLFYNYVEKQNDINYGGELAINRKIGTELRYNVASKSSLSANFNFINISFTNSNNATIVYEMLEGLNPGQNLTWGVIYQQSLSKYMQLNLTYNGRQSENNPIIHSGGVQVRAFF